MELLIDAPTCIHPVGVHALLMEYGIMHDNGIGVGTRLAM